MVVLVSVMLSQWVSAYIFSFVLAEVYNVVMVLTWFNFILFLVLAKRSAGKSVSDMTHLV